MFIKGYKLFFKYSDNKYISLSLVNSYFSFTEEQKMVPSPSKSAIKGRRKLREKESARYSSEDNKDSSGKFLTMLKVLNTGKTKYMEIGRHRGMIVNEHIRIGRNSYEKRKPLNRIFLITYFSTVDPLTSCVFFPVGLSSLTRHFSTGLVVPSVSWLEQLTEGTTRPVEDVLTTKGLQERK